MQILLIEPEQQQRENDLIEQEEKANKKLEDEVAMERPEKLLDDVIDAKASAILAERDGDMFDDSGHVEIQEDVEAKASKLCSLLRDRTKQQKMVPPSVEAWGKIRIKIKRRSKRREEKEYAKEREKATTTNSK
jgi:hypothetical protein